MVEAEDAGPEEIGGGGEGARAEAPSTSVTASPAALSLSSSGSGGGLLQSYLSMAGDGLRRLHGDTKAWVAPGDAAGAGAATGSSTRSRVAELERLLGEEREKRQQEAEHFKRVMESVQDEMARMVEVGGAHWVWARVWVVRAHSQRPHRSATACGRWSGGVRTSNASCTRGPRASEPCSA